VNYEKDTKQRIIEAGKRAIEHLIKVAEEDIDLNDFKSDDEFDASAFKSYTSTKKIAVFDSIDILERITEVENSLNGDTPRNTVSQGFAESRAK
jgi:hypothetical protein